MFEVFALVVVLRCNPLAGLFVCILDGYAFVGGNSQLQSPRGAFCLHLVIQAILGVRPDITWLQSPRGTFCLHQHTPKNTVLHRCPRG